MGSVLQALQHAGETSQEEIFSPWNCAGPTPLTDPRCRADVPAGDSTAHCSHGLQLPPAPAVLQPPVATEVQSELELQRGRI